MLRLCALFVGGVTLKPERKGSWPTSTVMLKAGQGYVMPVFPKSCMRFQNNLQKERLRKNPCKSS